MSVQLREMFIFSITPRGENREVAQVDARFYFEENGEPYPGEVHVLVSIPYDGRWPTEKGYENFVDEVGKLLGACAKHELK